MRVPALRRARVCAGVIGALGAVTGLPAAASAVVVAQPGAATKVREYGGTIVFSSFDQADGRWHLTIRKAGAKAPQRLPVAPSPTPFGADIGTDTAGRPELIYQRCALSTTTIVVGTMPITISRRVGCELFVYSLADGTGERAVRNANDGSRNDVSPTLWRGRIAWTREYGSANEANDIVYTKTLTAPRSQPSRRLPGVPQTRCGDVDPVCGPTTDRDVQALELVGDDLAVIVDYGCKGCSGIAQAELRLDAVADGTSRRVASIIVGLNGQQLVGPSLADGRLGWYRACAVEDMSCRTAVGPWRYRLTSRSYERATSGPIRMSGYADSGSQLYEVLGCTDPAAGAQENADCRIERITPPRYAPASAPVR